jgi:hypothetical protein
MKVMYERVAGIDVHKDMIKVAIRSPGEKQGVGAENLVHVMRPGGIR